MKKLFLVLGCLLLATPALAQDVRSMAVLPAQNVGLDESTAEIFNELFIAKLSKMAERRIITMRDIEAMLGFEQTKQAFDCSEMSCLAEIGGSLGVDELLYPRVTGIGDELMLSFTLLDVAKAEVLGRSSVTIENDANNYREASNRALNELWSAVGIEPTEKAEPAAAPSQSDVKLESSPSPSFTGPSTVSWILMGSGAAMLGAGTYFGLDARSKYDLAQSGDVGSQAAIDEGKQSALLTNIFIGAGALALSVGVSLWLFGGDSDGGASSDSALSFVPFASPEGSGVLLQGSFR